MIWQDLIDMCQDSAAENIADSATNFLQKTPLKLYGSAYQNHVSRATLCLQSTYTIATVANQEMYTLPPDFIKTKALRFSTLYFLKEIQQKPTIATTTTGNPIYFWIQGNQIGLWPIPTAVYTLTLWYYQLSPTYLFKLNNYGAHTTATYQVLAGPTLKIITAGGTGTTGTFTFATGTYTTYATLKTAVETACTGVKLVASSQTVTTKPTTTLELVSTATSFASVDKSLYLDPEIPEEMHLPILYNAMMAKVKLQDREVGQAQLYLAEASNAVEYYKSHYKLDRITGTGNLPVSGEDKSATPPVPLGTGGFLIIN